MAKYKTERGRTVCSTWNFALGARALHSCLLLSPMLCIFKRQQRGGEFAQFGTFPLRLEARALSSCVLLLHILYLFSFCFFIFCFFVLLFVIEAQQDTRVSSSWHPQVKFIGREAGGVPLAH